VVGPGRQINHLAAGSCFGEGQAGLVTSLARPGGNVTGPTLIQPELSGKRLDLLNGMIPKLKRVVVLWNPANRSAAADWEATKSAGPALNLRIKSVEVLAPEAFEAALATIARERPDGLLVLLDALMGRRWSRIAEFAAEHRLPTVADTLFAQAGGLIGYGPDFAETWQRAGAYVGKILKGAKPADLPVEQPTKYELVINLKTAKALGLTIPPSLLARADQVIE
jgi:putative ABC transport system substrate-binding protein